MNEKKVILLSKNVVPSMKDNWLAGFTDAEGCFTCSLLKNSSAYRFRYLVAQKGIENKGILEILQSFFGGKVTSMHVPDMYQLTVNGCKNAEKVMHYFDTYSLRTKKKESFSIWKSVHDDLLNKKHLQKDSREILMKKVITINT